MSAWDLVAFRADYPLLVYHLKSVIQNAVEAVDLVAALDAKPPQTIRVECKKVQGETGAIRSHGEFAGTGNTNKEISLISPTG
jgi:hypothetical protein